MNYDYHTKLIVLEACELRSPGDSRFEALTEPNVYLSIYPAPFIQSISKNEQIL